MGILEIMLFGIVVNVVSVVAFVVFFTVMMLISIVGGNFELMLWIEKVNPKVNELKELRKTKSFFVRHHNNIIRILPFSALLVLGKMSYEIYKYGIVKCIDMNIEKERIYLESAV